MLVVFRTDASPRIGTGHLMRCLVLADALAARGARCLFLCRNDGLGAAADRIAAAGHRLLPLAEGETAVGDLPHSAWLPHGQARDAELSLAALAGQPMADWLVVDHYALDARWQRRLRPAARRILAIDDLADRDHDCDLLLDQNLDPAAGARYAHRLPASAAALIGPRYALLRRDFAPRRIAALARPRPEKAERLLVMFGGADAPDLTGRTVGLLAAAGYPGAVDVVAGPLYANTAALKARLAPLPGMRLHVSPPKLTELMAGADLAVGSPGVTSWERCALGLPTIAVAAADNQEAMAEALGAAGAHLYLGRQETLADTDLAAAIALLTANRPWRQHMGEAAAAQTDGRGAERVARRLVGPAIALRPATLDDAALLHAWRNDPRVRQQAFDPAPIPWEAHRYWMARTLADAGRHLLVAAADSAPAGCVRYDVDGREARISIYLDPERLGQGLAIPILEAADAWLAARQPEVREVVAEVRAGNGASAQSFLGAGYAADHTVFTKRLGASGSP